MDWGNWLVKNGKSVLGLIEDVGGWVILVLVVLGLIYLLRWMAIQHAKEVADRKRCDEERQVQLQQLAEQKEKMAVLDGDVRVVNTKLEAEREKRDISESRIEAMVMKNENQFEKLHRDVLNKIEKMGEQY